MFAPGGHEMSDILLVDRKDGIATLTLNRPDAMNALSQDLRIALARAFRELASDDEVGVVILTGSGRAFSAGLDLKELGAGSKAAIGQAAGSGGEARDSADIVRAMEACDRPIIGAINGFAITGGFELALACDVLIASSEARFADTHARVGIMPGWGLSQKLSRLLGIYRAKEISLTGNFVLAAQALEWGLVNRVVSPEELLPTCRALGRDMLSCDPVVMRAYKRVIDDGFDENYAVGRRIERDANRAHSENVTPESIEGRRRGIQERGRSQSQ
jgi:enoyl-CoA hydratase